MSDPADPPPSANGHASNTNENESITPSVSSKAPSILGLALVSALNIACVAFVAFHYTTDADELIVTESVERRAGNISLEPATATLLAIASHIERETGASEAAAAELTVAALPEETEITPAEPSDVSVASSKQYEAMEAEAPERWVQLGALSDLGTARSYWSKLQQKSDALLGSHQPTIVGPDQVGGSLYHLRVGPLPAHHAGNLCLDLKQAGVDCFCTAERG